MKNVIFAGVGGQGVILASKILMEIAKKAVKGVFWVSLTTLVAKSLRFATTWF